MSRIISDDPSHDTLEGPQLIAAFLGGREDGTADQLPAGKKAFVGTRGRADRRISIATHEGGWGDRAGA
jgi:hypothetical protein